MFAPCYKQTDKLAFCIFAWLFTIIVIYINFRDSLGRSCRTSAKLDLYRATPLSHNQFWLFIPLLNATNNWAEHTSSCKKQTTRFSFPYCVFINELVHVCLLISRWCNTCVYRSFRVYHERESNHYFAVRFKLQNIYVNFVQCWTKFEGKMHNKE